MKAQRTRNINRTYHRRFLNNLAKKRAKFVHNLFLVCLSISTCFGRLFAHHQEKQLCLCDTWYLLFCVDDCLVCRSICSCIPDSHPHRIASIKCRINTVVSPGDGQIVARNMQRLINILRIHWGDLGVDGWIILGWISRRWDVGI